MSRFFWLFFLIAAGCAAQPSATGAESQLLATFTAAKRAYESGELTAAEQGLLAVVAQSPKFSEAYYYLGNIYIRRVQLEQAIDAYERCLELDPEHLNALFNASVADGVRARRRLERLKSLLPDNHPITESMELYRLELTETLGRVVGNRPITAIN